MDGLADRRKFFAGLAMTIMLRERAGIDFVDLKGKTINDFYRVNLDLEDDDPAATRVVRTLDRIAQLPGFERLAAAKPTFSMIFHLAVLVDSLEHGNYVPVWRDRVVDAFATFQKDVAEARLHYRTTGESLPHYERFAVMLAGGGADTAEVIRSRHAFFLAKAYPLIPIKPRDPNRSFDALEKEVIWNRDRQHCQNPDCKREVPLNEAAVHHVVEHQAGGATLLDNGVLVCRGCHADRTLMLRLTPHFQAYLKRFYAAPDLQLPAEPTGPANGTETDCATRGEVCDQRPPAMLTIHVSWGRLGLEMPDETICEPQATDSILKLLSKLLTTFGKPMEQQLTQLPIIRFPLSKRPTEDFINRGTGRPFSHLAVRGTDLYFCPHSDNREKARRLRRLVSRLKLPDGSDFSEGSIEFSVHEPQAPGD